MTTTTTAQPITAQTILRLFPDIDTTSDALDGHDEEQIRLMDEVCIVLDENDMPIGTASKKLCTYFSSSRLLWAAIPDHRFCRPFDDQYRQGSPPPGVLCLPLR